MKNAAKKKAPAIDVPQTDEAADALLKEYGDEFTFVARRQADLDSALAKLKATYEELAKPHQERMNEIFEQLQAWGAAHRDRLTDDGKSKTVTLPAGAIGWRQRPPSVRWKKGFKADDIIEAIKKIGLRRFIRVKEEPNKERMLEEPELAGEIDGVIIGSAGEEFYVAPFGAELAEPKR